MLDDEDTPSLEDIAQRLERIEGLLDQTLVPTLVRLERTMKEANHVAATVTDIVDNAAARAAASGVDIDSRVKNVMTLIERLTEPRVASALESILDRIDRVKILVEQADELPALIATLADIIDEFLLHAAGQGLDIQSVFKTAVDIMGRLGHLLQSTEFQAILDSGILDPGVVGIVAQLGTSLRNAREEDGDQAGWMALWRASRDPDVQRTLDFTVRFLRHIGRQLDQSRAVLASASRKELASA